MSKGSGGGGYHSRQHVEKSVRTGSGSKSTRPAGVSQIGYMVGDHTTNRPGSSGYRGEPLHNNRNFNPTKYGNEQGRDFEEYHTRKKISEDQVAGGSIIADASTFGLLELVLFPYAVCHTTWTTLAGQTLLFEYAENGDVVEVRIDGTSMKARAQLP